jgi:hypothetical protein
MIDLRVDPIIFFTPISFALKDALEVVRLTKLKQAIISINIPVIPNMKRKRLFP